MGRNTENAVKLFHELMDEPNDYEHIVVNALLGINLNLAIIADAVEENKLLNNTIDDIDKSLKRIALDMDITRQEQEEEEEEEDLN